MKMPPPLQAAGDCEDACMYKYLLFAGTTEGRQIAEFLKTQSIPVCVFTATEYGSELIDASDTLHVVSGRLDREQMYDCFTNNRACTVIDATHPYATAVSENLRSASEAAGCRYIRVCREQDAADWRLRQGIVTAASVEEAVSFLAGTTGRILLTTGSKNLKDFARLPDFEQRVYARILSIPASMELAAEAGLAGEHLMCMQGPFSQEMNEACIRHVNASWLVTKETGTAGGFLEKLDAAQACGCKTLVIGRPQETGGISVAQCVAEIAAASGSDARRIALIGTGVGADLTESAAAFLEQSDLIIGAGRIVEEVLKRRQSRITSADLIYEYRASEIREILLADQTHRQIAILFSGDTGFFSGAAAFSEEIRSGEMVCFPGISSLSAFAARIGFSWNEVKIVSIHGRRANVIAQVRKNRYVFCLLGRPDDVRNICTGLIRFCGSADEQQDTALRLSALTVSVGEKMGTPDEKIISGTPESFLTYENDPIAVMLIENTLPDRQTVPGIADEAFQRGNVPMTKEEIRTLAVSKLRLRSSDIVYDIGAGTGSISIEAARMVPDGTVYAVEVNPEGAALIRSNRSAFGADNLQVIEGHAPEALEDLPAPDAALIGGSKGTIGELIRLLYEKNPSVRIVVTAITLETVSAVLAAVQELKETAELKDTAAIQHEVVQVSVARSRQVGNTHMMMGQNPIFLMTLWR